MTKQNVIKLGCELYGHCEVRNPSNLVSNDLDLEKNGYGKPLNSDDKHIHHSIPQQMATFLNLDYNRRVSFLKAYWKWAELENKPYYDLKNHLNVLNLEHRLYEYAKILKDEYLFGFPDTKSLYSVLDILIRNSKDIHASTGTEEYIRFMHNLVTSNISDKTGKYVQTSGINVYFPGVDMFRTSDGKWVQETGTMYITNNSDMEISELKNKVISQKINGKTISAIIVNASPFTSGNFDGIKLTVENIKGYAEFSEDVKLNINEYVYPILEATVVDGGSQYEFGALFDTTSTGLILTRECHKTGELDIGISGNLSNVKIKRENSNSNIVFTRNKNITLSNDFLIGVKYKVEVDSSPMPVYIEKVDDSGSILNLKFDENEPVIGMSEINISGNSVIKPKKSTMIKSGKFFKNSDGFTSDRPVLQDSKYYQDYSYEIQVVVDELTSPNVEYTDISVPVGMIGYKSVKSVSLGCTQNNATEDGFYRKV